MDAIYASAVADAAMMTTSPDDLNFILKGVLHWNKLGKLAFAARILEAYREQTHILAPLPDPNAPAPSATATPTETTATTTIGVFTIPTTATTAIETMSDSKFFGGGVWTPPTATTPGFWTVPAAKPTEKPYDPLWRYKLNMSFALDILGIKATT